jgi:hypothetical protein
VRFGFIGVAALSAFVTAAANGPDRGTRTNTSVAPESRAHPAAARTAGSSSVTPAVAASQEYNIPYDGRFTFARLRFTPSSSFEGMGGGGRGGPDLKWDHDYPRAERHLMKILEETTVMRPYLDGGNIYATDDPELMKYPVAYLSEPGFWTMTEKEVEGLRNYDTQIHRVLPDAQLIELDETAAIFNTFFDVESLETAAPTYGRRFKPTYFGIFEDNDRDKRLLVIANYNNDLGDLWEWSDTGFLPVQVTNEAYKLGVNYIVYGMTH